MPRAKGWKPLSYATIAMICGRLCLGQGRHQVAREMGIPRPTVGHLRKALADAGALPRNGANRLSEELVQEIDRLVRAAEMSNYHIMVKLGLNWTGAIRARRKDFHDELRAKGEPVPRCQCGDEFQHAQVCEFKGVSSKPFDPGDTAEAIKDLQAGVPLEEMAARYLVSMPAVCRLFHSLTPKQRRKRQENVRARRVAAGRRTRKGMRFEGLYERLDAAVPRNIPAEVRSEILQEMALQILNGDVIEQQALERLRSFSSQAYRQFGDRWGTVSIDADCSGRALAETIEDRGALAEFDSLDELEVGGVR